MKAANAPFHVVPLAAQHDRVAFACGNPALDQYFKNQVSQDVKRRVASCFVALGSSQGIAGFYTLSATSVALTDLTDLPASNAKKLPRYPLVPAVRMRRLAVSSVHQGLGLGAALLGAWAAEGASAAN